MCRDWRRTEPLTHQKRHYVSAMTTSTATTSFTVHYTAKNGQAAKATFPTEALASAYSKTVKSARIVPSNMAVQAVNVTACPEGTVQAQQAATKAYYAEWRKKPGQSVEAEDWRNSAENRAERQAEHFMAARFAGQSMEDAWADWDYDNCR
jgi:hypothetical protein